jgi:hypothetical protein
MKTKFLLFSLMMILLSFTGIYKGYSQIVISGYLANPASTDGSYEYVQLVATDSIDFSVDTFTVVWCNNGAATTKGWINGFNLTYGFTLDSGSVSQGETFYVGGAMKMINGVGSTDISGAKWIRAKFTATQAGDGFGAAASGGNLGNGGTNADGIAVFEGSVGTLDSNTVPIDVVFFGGSIGTAKPSAGGVYTVADNDRYNTSSGRFGDNSNTYIYADVVSANFYRLKGTYNLSTNTWSLNRTGTNVPLTTTSALTDISDSITLYTPPPPTPTVTINSYLTGTKNVVQNTNTSLLYHLSCDVLSAKATLDSILFSTYGNFYNGDIKAYGFKFWHSSDAVFSTGDVLIDSVDAMGPGNLWFKNIAHLMPVNTSAHFFVTVDISSMANLGDSIYIDSLMLGDIYIATATKNGANPQSKGSVLTVISSSSPVIYVTSIGNFSNQPINSTSIPQSYYITGANLFPASGDIIITPPAGFEISLSLLTGYTDSFLTLPYTLGTINPTDIYVVFKPTQIKAYSGNISHAGGNASQNLIVSGTGISDDLTKPQVVDAYAQDINTFKVVFSEAVSLTAELKKNYSFIPVMSLDTAYRDASLKIVTLIPTLPLQKGVPVYITVDTLITDTCSNFNYLATHAPFELFIPAELSINEIFAKSTTMDDFIEIYNPNLTKPISMKGWYLTNDSASLKKWAFPDTTIPAAGYIVVWDNQHPANPGLHCNFTLSNTAAGKIVLRDDANTTVAYAKYPVPKADTSYARIPNGTGSFAYAKPTPGAATALYPKPIKIYTIAQVTSNSAIGESDSLNVYCKVVGIVYGVNFSDKGLSFTLIDNTGGINIFKSGSNVTPPYTAKEGDKIRTIGKIQMYNGLTELAVDSIVRLDSNQTLKTALVVTTLDETTESELIKLESLWLVPADTLLWPKVAGNAINVRAYNASNDTFTIRIHKKCDLQGTNPPSGRFDLTGLGNQYDITSPYFQNYQIWPRYKADLVTIVGIETETNALGLSLYPNPNNGRFVVGNPSGSKLQISVFNAMGENIFSTVTSQSTVDFNITENKGLYFVKAMDENGRSSILKVVVK